MSGSTTSDLRPKASLASVVVFVYDLQNSVKFYETVLAMDVTIRTESVALLVTAEGFQLYLRDMGPRADHALGSIGTQHVAWAADTAEDLARFETILKDLGAHNDTTTTDGITVVEGRDPNNLSVIMVYPGPDRSPRHHVMSRICGW